MHGGEATRYLERIRLIRQWPIQLLSIGFLILSSPAWPADLTVGLRDQSGKPVEDAVISVTSQAPDAEIPPRPLPVTKLIDQKNEAFVPFLEIFRPGDRLVFHNSDVTRHHVYSFSSIKSFEFVLATGESSAPISLDEPGVIAIGCNIHDSMIAYAFVSNAPWVGRSDANGKVLIEGLHAGAYTVAVWHPRQHPGKEQAPQRITIDPVVTSVNAAFSLSLLPDPREPENRERTVY